MEAKYTFIDFAIPEKKHIKNCQIRHTYGDEDGEETCNEEEALLLTERAIADGTAGPPPMLAPVPPLKESTWKLGGENANGVAAEPI